MILGNFTESAPREACGCMDCEADRALALADVQPVPVSEASASWRIHGFDVETGEEMRVLYAVSLFQAEMIAFVLRDYGEDAQVVCVRPLTLN